VRRNEREGREDAKVKGKCAGALAIKRANERRFHASCSNPPRVCVGINQRVISSVEAWKLIIDYLASQLEYRQAAETLSLSLSREINTL